VSPHKLGVRWRKVASYAAEHPLMGYRALCEAFNLSVGSLSAISRRRRKRNASTSVFVVQHENEGKELTTAVTVTGSSIEEKRRAIAHYYETDDITAGDDPQILRRVEYTIRERNNRFPST